MGKQERRALRLEQQVHAELEQAQKEILKRHGEEIAALCDEFPDQEFHTEVRAHWRAREAANG